MDCSVSNVLPKPKTVSVNGVIISREAIAREVQNHPAEKPILAWQAAARALVVRELLLQEAARLNVVATPLSDPDGRTETADEAAMRTLVEREVATPEPDEEVCRRFYERNRHRFRLDDLHEASHILVAAPRGDEAARSAARANADTILAAVKSDPSTFADLAINHSDCTTSATDGGYLGQITRGQTVQEFEVALERMKPGEIATIETRYGFHVVRLDRRAEGQAIPFEIARERIADYLASSVEHRAIAQYISILAGRAEIAGISLAAANALLVQ